MLRSALTSYYKASRGNLPDIAKVVRAYEDVDELRIVNVRGRIRSRLDSRRDVPLHFGGGLGLHRSEPGGTGHCQQAEPRESSGKESWHSAHNQTFVPRRTDAYPHLYVLSA